jgi:pimeloyl-ACP methyl ester carboxylesterase
MFSVGGTIDLRVLTAGVEDSLVPVLMVHGLASNARLWDGVAERLARAGHPVAAVDQRGHGQSSKPDSGYDFATLTGDLVALLEQLDWVGSRKPLVAGQSWGANVVLELAARHPDATAALALVDGGTMELSTRFADWPTCEAALAPPQLAGTNAVEFERTLRSYHPDWPASGIAGTLANVEVLADGTIRPWLSRSHHMNILWHLWEHHPGQRYGLVKVPVLILPAEDPSNQRWMNGKREEVARAAAGLDRSLTRWITGDHDLHAQHPDLVAQLIHDASGQPPGPQ